MGLNTHTWFTISVGTFCCNDSSGGELDEPSALIIEHKCAENKLD